LSRQHPAHDELGATLMPDESGQALTLRFVQPRREPRQHRIVHGAGVEQPDDGSVNHISWS
jgi:hypothetical protein